MTPRKRSGESHRHQSGRLNDDAALVSARHTLAAAVKFPRRLFDKNDEHR